MLYARIGIPHCPKCGKEIKQQTIDQMVDAITAYPEGTRLQVLSPVVRARKGEHAKVLEDARKSGFVRVRVDGELYELDDTPALDKKKKHTIELVIDRLIVRPGKELRQRLADYPGDCLRPLRGAGDHRPVRQGGAALQPELRLPGLRHQH